MPRDGQAGTWITAHMVEAYCALHRAGIAHSVETWLDGSLVGGLYGVALGRAFFGESMFAHVSECLQGRPGQRWCASSSAGASE